MSWLLEDPTPLVLVGIVVEAILGFAYVSTVRREILWAMGGVLGVVLAGLAIEASVVTDRERVEATLDGGVAALKSNDRQRILSYLSPAAIQTRARVDWALAMVEITDVRLSGLHIQINRLTEPPTAKAKFDAFFRFRDRTGQIPHRTYAAKFTVELELVGDQWLVTDHSEYENFAL